MKLNKTGLRVAGTFFIILISITILALWLSYGVIWMLNHWGGSVAFAVTLGSVFIPVTILIYFLASDEEA